MSIIISNISPEDAPNIGVNQYEVRINRKRICTFEHERALNGLSECLRDAAKAVDEQDAKTRRHLLEIASEGFKLDNLLG